MANTRDFDIVVYGATGFTGRLICEYLNTSYGTGSGFTWAIAGRNQEKLELLRDELGLDKTIPLLVADTSDQQALGAMVARTKVLLSAVGPYQNYGSDVVKACAEAGTDYLDLCGEPAWMKEMIDAYNESAKSSGARIVFSCGFDSIPSDLGIYCLQQAAIEKFGRPMPRVKGRVKALKGTASGGTVASFMATMAAAKEKPELYAVLANPFALTGDFTGPQQPDGDKKVYDEDLQSWAAPFVMATINTKNVHRSNLLLDHLYGKDFVYDEMRVVDAPDKAKETDNSEELGFDVSLKPGEGPSKEQRESGFYTIDYVGSAPNGDGLCVSVTGDQDPGYGSTSKMIAEAAICLLQTPNSGGGCMTAAPAMGARLIERLQANAGISFEVES